MKCYVLVTTPLGKTTIKQESNRTNTASAFPSFGLTLNLRPRRVEGQGLIMSGLGFRVYGLGFEGLIPKSQAPQKLNLGFKALSSWFRLRVRVFQV